MKRSAKRILSLLLVLAFGLSAAALAASGGGAVVPAAGGELYVYTDPTSMTMNTGEQRGISTTVTNSDGTVTYTWTTSNSSVATVSESGAYATVTARGMGTASITVWAYRASDGNSDSAVVSVTVKKAGNLALSVEPSSAVMTVGDTLNVSSTGFDLDGTENYIWSSSNVGVATAAGSGRNAVITANNTGTAIVTVNAQRRSDGMNASAIVNVTVNPRVTGISVNRTGSASFSLKTGQDQVLGATVSGGSGSCTYAWVASGSVAIQSQAQGSAVVRASGVGAGTATLTVRDTDTGSTGTVSWSFTVEAPVVVPKTPAAMVGKTAGEYFSTDVVTTVNGAPIHSINIGGRTLICAEEMSYHGFRVVWDGAARTLSVSKGAAVTGGGPVVSASELPVGSKLGDYLYTDIATYLDGAAIAAYNTGGRTWFCAEDMRDYGYSVLWDGATRSLTVTSR